MLWMATAHLLVVAGAGSGAEDLHCTVLCRKLLVFVEGFVRWPALLSLRPFLSFSFKKRSEDKTGATSMGGLLMRCTVADALHCR
jgi:hypothetical protein